MALDWGCSSRCLVWYLTSQSRLYEHYLIPDVTGPGSWSVKLRVSIAGRMTFHRKDSSCSDGRQRGGMSLTFSESPFGMTSASAVVFSIDQGRDMSVQLRHYRQGNSAKFTNQSTNASTGLTTIVVDVGHTTMSSSSRFFRTALCAGASGTRLQVG